MSESGHKLPMPHHFHTLAFMYILLKQQTLFQNTRTQTATLQEKTNTVYWWKGKKNFNSMAHCSTIFLPIPALLIIFLYFLSTAVCVTDSRGSREGVIYVSSVNSCEWGLRPLTLQVLFILWWTILDIVGACYQAQSGKS